MILLTRRKPYAALSPIRQKFTSLWLEWRVCIGMILSFGNTVADPKIRKEISYSIFVELPYVQRWMTKDFLFRSQKTSSTSWWSSFCDQDKFDDDRYDYDADDHYSDGCEPNPHWPWACRELFYQLNIITQCLTQDSWLTEHYITSTQLSVAFERLTRRNGQCDRGLYGHLESCYLRASTLCPILSDVHWQVLAKGWSLYTLSNSTREGTPDQGRAFW